MDRETANQDPADPAGALLVPYLIGIAKSVRQLVALRLSGTDVEVGQDQFLACFERDESLHVSDIASRLSVRPSTVSKMMDRMQEKGWTTRHDDMSDGRRTLIGLSEEGKRAREMVRALHAELAADLTKAMDIDRSDLIALVQLDAVLTKRLSRFR